MGPTIDRLGDCLLLRLHCWRLGSFLRFGGCDLCVFGVSFLLLILKALINLSIIHASLQAAASQMVAALCRGLERLLAEGGAVAREVGLAGSSDTIASYARRAEKSETLNL